MQQRRWIGLVLLTLTTMVASCGGPLGPFAGGKLSGEEASFPDDWGFVESVEVVALETNPNDPHSINVWIGAVDNALYIPTSLILGDEQPTERGWVKNVMEDPRIRLKIEGKVYSAKLERVTAPDDVAQIKSHLLRKYQEEPTQHSDNAWIYQVMPRG